MLKVAAARFGRCRPTLTGRIELGDRALDVVEAILAGRQPRSLTRHRLATTILPINRPQQRQMLEVD